MKVSNSLITDTSYRALYGQLFSALTRQFGLKNINEIEDAIQSAFLKSLRLWKADHTPVSLEKWLFIVAKNDLINRLKSTRYLQTDVDVTQIEVVSFQNESDTEIDLRLQTILFLSSSKSISIQSKIIFILKNIFGLNVKEISWCTCLGTEAIYKRLNRAKFELFKEYKNKSQDVIDQPVTSSAIATVADILYAVFQIGLSPIEIDQTEVYNEDLCLDALALSKQLMNAYPQPITNNLFSLFCFQLAQKSAQHNLGEFDNKLMNLGFQSLQEPKELHRYHLEALLAAKYLTAKSHDQVYYDEVESLHRLLLKNSQSSFVPVLIRYFNS